MDKCIYCKETRDICKETFKCMLHCEFETHSHFSVCYCESIDICAHSKCAKHCEETNHNHCFNDYCNLLDLCDKLNFSCCIKHCKIKFHDHCIVNYCDSKIICEDSKCASHCNTKHVLTKYSVS